MSENYEEASRGENQEQEVNHYQTYFDGDVAGPVHTGVGDINVYKETSYQASDFLELELENYLDPHFVSPPFIPDIITKVKANSFLIVGGEQEINKKEIIRHVAAKICEIQTSDELTIREWQGSSESEGSKSLGKIDLTLQQTSTPTVFVLPELAPQDINYDPLQIQRFAMQYGHMIIASSDLAKDAWKLEVSEREFWLELMSDNYSSQYLTLVLRKKINDSQMELPDLLIEKDWGVEQDIVAGYSLKKAAEKLKSPENIALFVQLLCIDKVRNSDDIVKLVDQVSEQKSGLRGWYYQLAPRKQLLVGLLVFFDGLFDDQFFAALEAIAETVWRQKNPQLEAFDYRDLDDMRILFNIVETRQGAKKIESRSASQRRDLLDMVWETHRRYLLSALPYLVELVEMAAGNRARNRELYGSDTKKEQLRSTVSELLSYLGIKSSNVVEDSLAQLAASKYPTAQFVAASALARWRVLGHEYELFRTLRRWKTDSHFRDVVKTFIDSEQNDRYGASDYVRATIAMTIAEASNYDRPNQLTPEIVNLFQELAYDKSTLVRARFKVYTLPWITRLHWQKVQDVLRKIVEQRDMIKPVANSLVQAYRSEPVGILTLLDNWERECLTQRPAIFEDEGRREKLLSTVVLTYGYLPYHLRIGAFRLEDGLEKLRRILDNDKEHPFVRVRVIEAINLQAKRDFRAIEPYLRRLIPKAQIDEQEEIINLITSIYLQQRSELEGGQLQMRFKGKEYPVWLEGTRPFTEVEVLLKQWVKNPVNTIVQQVALKIFVNFAKVFDGHETFWIQQHKERTSFSSVSNVQGKILLNNRSSAPLIRTHWQAPIAAWLVTIGREAKLRAIIQGLIPEALNLKQTDQAEFEHLMSKWLRDSNNGVKDVGLFLPQAVSRILDRTIIRGIQILAILLFIFLFVLSIYIL